MLLLLEYIIQTKLLCGCLCKSTFCQLNKMPCELKYILFQCWHQNSGIVGTDIAKFQTLAISLQPHFFFQAEKPWQQASNRQTAQKKKSRSNISSHQNIPMRLEQLCFVNSGTISISVRLRFTTFKYKNISLSFTSTLQEAEHISQHSSNYGGSV